MRVLIDFNGTMEGNLCGATLAETLQAAQDISDAGHQIRFVSGDPGAAAAKLGSNYTVTDKAAAFNQTDLRDAMVIDDDHQTLAACVRRGAIAVPAHRLLDVADAMVPSRPTKEREAAALMKFLRAHCMLVVP